MLVAIPAVILSNSALSVWKETALLFSSTWIYNDLGGGDDNWLVTNIIIAFAFFLYNLGSLRVACGASSQAEHLMGSAAFGWTAAISAVILTTMHVQDLKDQEGDRAHNRQTVPLVLGDTLARWTIAGSVLFWSWVCALFWGLWILPIGTGSYAAYRVLWERGKEADRLSVKAHPDLMTSAANLSFTNVGVNQDSYWSVVETFQESLPSIVDTGTVTIFVPTGESFTVMPFQGPGVSKAEMQQLLNPTLTKLDQEKIHYSMSASVPQILPTLTSSCQPSISVDIQLTMTVTRRLTHHGMSLSTRLGAD